MYVSGTDLFGLINYFVSSVGLLVDYKPSQIAITLDEELEVRSDALIHIELRDEGVVPFEVILHNETHRVFEGVVLNALSKQLSIRLANGKVIEELVYEKGERIRWEMTETQSTEVGTVLRFIPNNEIFSITTLSAPIFESYLRRLSYLHGGTRFSLTTADGTKNFVAERGILDLFDAISSPFQLMHQPIVVNGQSGELSLELIMAYHSWTDDHIYCYMNNGRAVAGGTHEDGLSLALTQLRERIKLPETMKNGIILLVSMIYPDATWAGCVKERINNPELTTLVSDLIVDEVERWLLARPQVLDEIRTTQTFRSADFWIA